MLQNPWGGLFLKYGHFWHVVGYSFFGCLWVYSIYTHPATCHEVPKMGTYLAALASTKTTLETASKSLDLVGSLAIADLAADFLPDVPCMACHASYIMICLQTLCNSHTWRGDGKLRQEVFFFAVGDAHAHFIGKIELEIHDWLVVWTIGYFSIYWE